MSVMKCSRHFRDQFGRLPEGHPVRANDFVERPPFNEFHTEVASAVTLSDFVNRNNPRIVQMGDRFRFKPKAFEVRFCGPVAEADHF